MPKRKPGRPRKDEMSAAESYRLPPEQVLKHARDVLAITETEPDKLEKHPAFPGVSLDTGNLINMITIMRIHGYWDNEIANELGTDVSRINKLEHRYSTEFGIAETTALATAAHKMEVNVLRVRAAASKRAPEMLDVLYDMAKNEEVAPHIRRDCARDWLNLMGMNMPLARGGSQNQLNKGTLVAIQQVFGDNSQSTDVIDAEVVND